MAKGKRWKWDYFFKMNIHEFHVTLAHKIDKDKMKAEVRKRNIKGI